MSPDNCPDCEAPFGYEREGRTYSHLVFVEIRGVYDGGLFYRCPFCGYCFHRWPEGGRLHAVAQCYIDRWNAERAALKE